MAETGRNVQKNQLNAAFPAPARLQRFASLAYPFLFEAEDDRSYSELLESVCAAVKPVNVIEEMFVADVVLLQWEILELRRLKSALIAVTVYEALKSALYSLVEYDLIEEEFEQRVAEELKANVSDDKDEGFVQELMRKYHDDEPGAKNLIDQILEPAGQSCYGVYKSLKDDKLEALARSCARRETDDIKQVEQLLAARGLTVHEVTVDPIMRKVEDLQRIDHLITSAENRRNTALHEIDRRWSRLGNQLRRSVEAQDAEFEVIHSEGKTAA